MPSLDDRSAPPLFVASAYHAEELDAGGIPELQRFFELNPQYFFAVNGQPPACDEAHEEVLGALPQGWPFTRKWIIGFMDSAGSLVGMANVVSDLLAPGVWHIGLFMIASTLQGSGAAQALYEALEHWARESGA